MNSPGVCAAPLAGQIGDHIGTAGGDADQVIKGLDIPVQQKIVNAGALRPRPFPSYRLYDKSRQNKAVHTRPA